MTVGETLTQARNQAGLSVDELSERTRIRETVIRSIERDEFEALGGDLYVRGYVRALAGAVGIDAQPLIHEYDLGRAAQGPNERANGSTGKHARGFAAAAPADRPGAEPPGADATRFDLSAVSEDPAVTRFDLTPVAVEPPAADEPSGPAEPPATAGPVTAGPAGADVPASGPGAADPVAPPADPAAAGPAAELSDEAAQTAVLSAVPTPDLVPPGAVMLPEAIAPQTVAFAAVPPPDPLADTRHDLPAITDDLMAAGYDLYPEQPGPAGPRAAAGDDAADSATSIIPALGPVPDGPREPAWPARQAEGGGTGERRSRRLLVVAAAVAVVVVAGTALGIGLTSGGTSSGTTAAPAARPGAASGASASTAATSSAEAQAGASASASASASRASASASASAEASKKAAKPASVVSLPLASARAYGPDGFGDGDDPGDAGYTIAGQAPQPWSTQWYATADFGMLKHGTGLLIDLGHQSTVTGIRLGLSQYRGADLEIRVGNGTAPSDLRLASAARNAGGVVRLALSHPATGRYLLVWFTKLPPNGAGHYQETVSRVMVSGHR